MITTEITVHRPKTVPNIPTFKLKTSSKTLQGENKWRERVSADITTSNNVIYKSDRHILYSKIDDPLTNLREVLCKLSNTEGFKYMRQCRLIVAKLRKCWVDVNEEMKPLTKTKEYLESAIDHVRKDVIITQETIDNRVHRSSLEPSQDTVDNNLSAEKQSLLTFKRSLETILKPVQDQLQKLDAIRETVNKLCKERSVVTDLICQCLTQSIRAYDRTTNKSKLNTHRSQPNLAASQQNFLFNSLNDTITNYDMGPLTAFTEEPIKAMAEANLIIAESKDLRNQSRLLIKDSLENIKQINKSVNEVFIKKIEETLALGKNLCISSAENQLAANRAVRWQDLNNISLKYTLGPEKNSNMNTYERLDRPIIKNFQKHPGNQVPEAQEIIKGTDALKESVKISENHIKTLKIIGQKLDANMKEKEAQAQLDCSLLRRRRELNDHRWNPVSYVKEK